MTGIAFYDRQPRQALDEMPSEARAAWTARSIAQDGAAPHAETRIERAKAALIACGRPATIRDVWVLLAHWVGSGDNADTRVVAALAGTAPGLRPA